MHQLFSFPIECRYEQRVYKRLVWRRGWVRGTAFASVRGDVETFLAELAREDITPPGTETDILQAEEEAGYSTYDAFNDSTLLPAVTGLVKRVKRGEDKKAAVKKWVATWGFLGANIHPTEGPWPPTWESLNGFWREAEALADLWGKYRQVTQRELRRLKEWIRFVPLDTIGKELAGGASTKSDFYPFDKPGHVSFAVEDIFFTHTLEEIGQNPLPFYQAAGLHYILTHIQDRLRGLEITPSTVRRIANPREDAFKVKPVIVCRNLLQAMYLQFFILLADETLKKVCPVCDRVFFPSRKDKQYCGDSCKLTAKSRRYRGRKKRRFF